MQQWCMDMLKLSGSIGAGQASVFFMSTSIVPRTGKSSHISHTADCAAPRILGPYEAQKTSPSPQALLNRASLDFPSLEHVTFTAQSVLRKAPDPEACHFTAPVWQQALVMPSFTFQSTCSIEIREAAEIMTAGTVRHHDCPPGAL